MKTKRNSSSLTPGQAADRILALKAEETAAAETAATEAAARVKSRYAERIRALLERSMDRSTTERMIAAVNANRRMVGADRPNGGDVHDD